MTDLQRLSDLAVSDTGFVFDPFTGSTFSANKTALLLIRGFKEKTPKAELIDILQREFEIEPTDTLERDVDEFIQVLRNYNLVSRDCEL
ncbi:MAG: PqqD family protein [Myxococcales bacterium]|nr:MAG: PqqD family protein [Myxococcales bacterium]